MAPLSTPPNRTEAVRGSSSWTRLDLSARWVQMKLGTRLSLRTATGWPSANCRMAIGICGCETCMTVKPADSLMRTATTQSRPGLQTRRPWFMPATAGELCGLLRSVVAASPNNPPLDPTRQHGGNTRARMYSDMILTICANEENVSRMSHVCHFMI